MERTDRQPDVILRGGTVADGTGAPPYQADVAITGDRIGAVGDLGGLRAPLEIDARGRYVTPGFIDSHSHADSTLWAAPECGNLLTQGITTILCGNCGYSMRNRLREIPFDPAGAGVTSVYDLVGRGDVPKGAMAAVLDKAEAMGAGVNAAWLCGHNDLRVIAGLGRADYTEEQFAVMEGFLREAMEAGFFGFSTGLEFDPGVTSRPEEVERLAAVAAEYGGNYASHMRDEGTYILEAVEEFLNVIRKTGMRGTVSHLNVKDDNGVPPETLDRAMQMLRDAREKEGLDVLTDMLSTCFATGGAQAMLPAWLYADGWGRAREILADPEGRKKVRGDLNRYWRFLAAGQWDRLLRVQPPYWPEVAGLPFSELVRRWGKDPADCFLDIVQAAPRIEDIRGCSMQGLVFREQTLLDSVVRDPLYLWMTDCVAAPETGPVAEIARNVQNYMGMTYFFTRYVRDLGAVPVEAAVAKVTGLPAAHYGFRERGILREGYFADVNVFDLDDLEIRSAFEDPCRYSGGFSWVFVNGKPAVADGRLAGERFGRVLRR